MYVYGESMLRTKQFLCLFVGLQTLRSKFDKRFENRKLISGRFKAKKCIDSTPLQLNPPPDPVKWVVLRSLQPVGQLNVCQSNCNLQQAHLKAALLWLGWILTNILYAMECQLPQLNPFYLILSAITCMILLNMLASESDGDWNSQEGYTLWAQKRKTISKQVINRISVVSAVYNCLWEFQ